MRPKTPKHLADIREAAGFILEATRGMSEANYLADRLRRHAVERNFEIIGEALRRVAQQDSVTAARISDYQQIISFRNLLIHGYDLVDDPFVWAVIQNQLPKLRDEVDALLKEQGQGA
jgi:uncharacterized protein with HEPN domain